MDIFNLAAKISLDSSEYEKGVQNASKGISALGGKLKTGLATAAKVGFTAVGAAAAGVAAVVKGSIDSFAEYEQLVGGVETLFKDSADTVQEYAANAYKTAGLSANEYMETVTSFSASLLQSLDGDTEKAARYADMAITDMSDNANKMGSSMESVQNAYQGFAKQNYTMLDNLKLGYGGTKQEMERLIQDAEKLDSSFKAARDENGDLVMSYADVVDAIHIVQTEMGITGTTAEEASKTISGSWNATKAAWKNLLTAFGSGKGVKEAIGNLVSTATTTVKNVIPVIKTALVGVADFVKEVGPVIIEELPGLIEELLPGLLSAAVSLVGALIQALPGILSALWETIKTLFSTFMDWLREQNPELAAVFDGIIEAGRKVIDFFANFRENVAQIWENIKTFFTETFENVKNSIIEFGESAKQSFTDTWNNIKNFVLSTWDSIKTGVSTRIENIKNDIRNKFENVRSTLSGIIERIKGLFNFEWSFPKPKMPHFSVSWEDWGMISIPRVSVDWYKKAYDTPYMFTEPTVMNGRGFGDGNGAEMVYGRDNLMRDIKEAVSDVSTANVTINVYPQKGQSEEEIARAVQRKLVQWDKQRRLAYA